jgi:hypothetical protein
MATTTNYGWTTPDDTSLVKDGAAAIRTLGSSVDTTTKNLNPETTLGDLAYRSSTANVKTRLGLGTAGQVLQVNSGANAPEWATPSLGGLTLISNTVLSANSALDLTSIAGTYKHLFLEWQGVYHSTSGTFFGIRLNNDSGSNYGFIASRASNAAVDTARATDTGIFRSGAWPFGEETTSSTLLDTANGSLIIYDYASTSLLKRFKGTWKHRNATGSTDNFVNIDGTYNSQTAITQVNIFRAGSTATMSNATNTSVRLWGMS